MEEQNQVGVGAETGGEREGGDDSVKDEAFEQEEDQEEDQDDLPHSEILDIFEEGLAQLVQDPLLCDLPIQVAQISHHINPSGSVMLSVSMWDSWGPRCIYGKP